MATQKTQTKNEKIVEQTDPNLENEVQQDTTPMWKHIIQPAIMTIIFLFAAIFLFADTKYAQNGLFIIATVSGIITIAIALGYRPKDNNKKKYQPECLYTNPKWSMVPGNAFYTRRNRIDRP